MTQDDSILIAGAGIGGLTAALCLVEAGFKVRVLEQASELKALGAGIQLSANATRVLYQLGLGPALEAVTITPGGKCVRLWNTGQEWEMFDLGRESTARFGYPYLMLYRPDLHQVLVDALEHRAPGALRLGARMADVACHDDHVTVTLQDGDTLTTPILIGADGIHSVARRKLIVQDEPWFSGCIAWRGVIPTERVPASMRGTSGVNWVGPGAHIIHYLVHGGDLVSFTGIVEKPAWDGETWAEQGTVEGCLADFAGWHDDVHQLIRQLESPSRWAMILRHPIANWTHGRVTLLGDAAHPTLPFLAQGAGMALEDARVLARALQAHRDAPEHALQVYQASRIDRTTRIVEASTANTGRFHNRELADAAGAAAYVAREWEQSTARARYDWVFRYEPENEPLAEPVVPAR